MCSTEWLFYLLKEKSFSLLDLHLSFRLVSSIITHILRTDDTVKSGTSCVQEFYRLWFFNKPKERMKHPVTGCLSLRKDFSIRNRRKVQPFMDTDLDVSNCLGHRIYNEPHLAQQESVSLKSV